MVNSKCIESSRLETLFAFTKFGTITFFLQYHFKTGLSNSIHSQPASFILRGNKAVNTPENRKNHIFLETLLDNSERICYNIKNKRLFKKNSNQLSFQAHNK